MVSKIFGLIVLAAVFTTGNCVTEIFLPDEEFTFLTNELIGKTMTIPKFFLDPLQSCHVTFPDGNMYEAYPNNNINDPNIFFLEAVEPFVSCAIGFLGAPITHSGTYELYSVVDSFADSSRTLTRKKFHMTLKDIEA